MSDDRWFLAEIKKFLIGMVMDRNRGASQENERKQVNKGNSHPVEPSEEGRQIRKPKKS